ncbi:helix-turn-helix transcriptional regulator [Stenotrophomonas sp. YIM B06876]|uniref:PadR family transcriptional regulator n=1 Tax=Stenotrophomonas sp. YIM B06876 TaxID=3060211 RepID=UPI0027391A80|nr:helix-turn-helix transcriptional regulator [Stenotrophomonas sp. YIM B06876]
MKSDHVVTAPRRRVLPRPLGRGDLRLLLLSLIGAQPRHGYELIQCISGMFVRRYTPSAGSVYPLLAQFEADGWAVAQDDAGRKRCRITAAGRAGLKLRDDQVQAALRRTRHSAHPLQGRSAAAGARGDAAAHPFPDAAQQPLAGRRGNTRRTAAGAGRRTRAAPALQRR